MTVAIRLDDRGFVDVAGEDAAKFLHNLVTNNITGLQPGEARFAALLTPQGKILFDFLVFALDPEHFLLDCPLALVADLTKRLQLYKMRAKVTVTDRSAELEAIALPDARNRPEIGAVALAADPRDSSLGWRAVATRGAVAVTGDRSVYEILRVRAGVPAGGVDFDYGGTFPHEADMDLFAGVDFKKGCFVGQEVVSRMKHRGLVRKRVTRYRVEGDAPAPGESIRAGEIEIGITGSRAGDEGLALVRLDRLADAKEKGDAPVAAGVALLFAEEAGSASS